MCNLLMTVLCVKYLTCVFSSCCFFFWVAPLEFPDQNWKAMKHSTCCAKHETLDPKLTLHAAQSLTSLLSFPVSHGISTQEDGKKVESRSAP